MDVGSDQDARGSILGAASPRTAPAPPEKAHRLSTAVVQPSIKIKALRPSGRSPLRGTTCLPRRIPTVGVLPRAGPVAALSARSRARPTPLLEPLPEERQLPFRGLLWGDLPSCAISRGLSSAGPHSLGERAGGTPPLLHVIRILPPGVAHWKTQLPASVTVVRPRHRRARTPAPPLPA